MGRTVNSITLVGYVGRDPEVRTTTSGKKVANISLATNRKVGEEERTDWHRLTLWDKKAELAESYVTKGERLFIRGRLEYGSYERDGVTIPTAEVLVHELIMLGGRSNGGPA